MASESPQTPDAPPKERRVVHMGKYEVVRHIATGGMGAVYQARDTETNRDVAVKVLQPSVADKPAMLERFRREAQSASKMLHEHIVSVYEIDCFNGMWYIAMEYVDGPDLHDVVKKDGPLDPEEALQVVLQGARALKHAHAQGVVHRDIKPSNFILTRPGGRPYVKLTDFGLARDIDDEPFRVTRAGTTVGTIDYMSPEQARDSGSADIRSDLYSLGCTWFHLLAGFAPFPKGGLGERLIKIMHEEPPDLREVNPRISDLCNAIVQKLMSKDPADRYQTPAELIDVLLSLEGKTTFHGRRPAPLRKTTVAAGSEKEASAALATENQKLWYTLAAVGVVMMLCAVVIAVAMPGKPPERKGDVPAPFVAETVTPTPVEGEPVQRKPETTTTKPAATGPTLSTVRAKPLPAMPPAGPAVNPVALRNEVETPWRNAAGVDEAAAVKVEVRRAGPGVRSLAEALKAGEPGKPLVVEVHDNGPLYEPAPEGLNDRDVLIRAGKGFRPLVIWDVPATMSRAGRKPADALAFFEVRTGRLFLDGLEFGWRWPESLTCPAAFCDVVNGELNVLDCTVSMAGKSRVGVCLARYRGRESGGRVRFSRCQIRGGGLVALDLDAPGADVLFDGCLVVGVRYPLLRVTAGETAPAVRLVRSTLVAGPTVLELRPRKGTASPGCQVLCWDSLLGHAGAGGKDATLVTVTDRADAKGLQWRAYNSAYAGWPTLVTNFAPVMPDTAAWHRYWGEKTNDVVVPTTWPEHVYNEPATQSAAVYQPSGPVVFASSMSEMEPVGCDLGALPGRRDTWLSLALDPVYSPPQLLTSDAAPPIPVSEDGKYHGGRIDLTTGDLGAELAKVQANKQLGPRVVLHLTGRGECPTSPIRLKGTHLVLYFEESADKDAPLSLALARSTASVPLLDLDGGSLDVINGTLHVPEQNHLKASHVIRVKGGDLRLHRTRVFGPQEAAPEGYVAAIAVHGSGDPTPDKGHTCAIHESVVLSSRVGIILDGVGCRLAMRQGVVVAGTDALHVLPGKECEGRAGMELCLNHSTLAARRGIVYLGDAPDAGVPTEPVLVQARECAYLSPFPGKAGRSGLLVYEGEALARGLLVWHGEREGYDPRLGFAAAPATAGEGREGYAPWKRLWGGVREPRDLGLMPLFDPRHWGLERLHLKYRDAPGANLDRLGLLPGKPPR